MRTSQKEILKPKDKNEKNCAMIQRALARRYKEERKREVKLKKDLKLLMKKVNELQSVAIDREKEYENRKEFFFMEDILKKQTWKKEPL